MVLLPGGYVLDADNTSITLYKVKQVKNKKTGEITVENDPVAHQGNFPAILRSWYNRMSRELIAADNQIELKELLAQMNALSNEVLRTVGTLTYSGGRLGHPTPLLPAQTTPSKGTHENAL